MSVVVRPFEAKDVPALLKFGRNFHNSTPIKDEIPFDVNSLADFIANSYDSETVRIWVAEVNGELVGSCAATIYPMYFNYNGLVSQELWWWLEPKARGSGAGKALYNAIEDWSREKGAIVLFMIALNNDTVETMGKLYARSGFKPMERTFVKRL